MDPKKVIRYAAILFLLASVSSLSAGVVCSLCSKPISGKYYVSPQNQNVCLDCASKYKACTACGNISKTLMDVNGLKLCKDCYLKVSKCDICGKDLTGSYNNYPEIGIKVCLDCEKTCQRCDSCRRPLKESKIVGGAKLCDRCAGLAQKCHSCGGAILRDYTYFEGNENLKYCADCVRRYHPCADCGAPSGSDGVILEDSRYLCRDCRKAALFEPGLISPIKKDVLAFMESNFGMTINHQIKYSLQGKDFLDKNKSGSHGDLSGLFHRKGDEFSIYVLYGLRRQDMIWVLAHEISHAWQSENVKNELSMEDLEGFAQWISYNALKYFGYGPFAENMIKGNTVYSTGLEKMIRMEKENGAKSVFEYIKSR